MARKAMTALRTPDAAETQPTPISLTPAEIGQHADACLQFFLDHLRATQHDPKTINSYSTDINRFRAAVGKDLLDVERADIYRVLEDWKRAGIKESTIQRRGSSLRAFYDLLFNAGLISVRPTANLRLPRAWVKVQRAAPAKDLERVIAAVGTSSPFDLRDRALLLLLRDTGPRANAIAHAELADLDWKLNRLFLRTDKFGKQKYVPLSKRTVVALQDYVQRARPYFLHGRDLPFLFLWSKGGLPLTRMSIWQITEGWTKKVLGKSYGPHCWRRTCLTEAADKGMDLFDIMALAGHSDPATTQRYINHQITGLKETFYKTHPRARKEPR